MMTTAHTNAIIDAQPDRLDTDLVATIVSFLPGEERTLAEHLEYIHESALIVFEEQKDQVCEGAIKHGELFQIPIWL